MVLFQDLAEIFAYFTTCNLNRHHPKLLSRMKIMRVNYTNVGIAIALLVACFIFFKLSQLSQTQAVTHQDVQGAETTTGTNAVCVNNHA